MPPELAFVLSVIFAVLVVLVIDRFRLAEPARPDEEIIAAMDPWTLCCAVGAANGTMEGSYLGLERWIRLSRDNWIPRLNLPGTSDDAILGALRRFVRENHDKHYRSVYAQVCAARGYATKPILGPGESMTIVATLPVEIGGEK